MNVKVNRSSDRDGSALKKSQRPAADQLFLSSDLKSQARLKNNSIKLQPIRNGSNANAKAFQHVGCRQHQDEVGVGHEQAARVEVFKQKINESLQKMRDRSPRSPSTGLP